jgi:competence protein ComEA
MFEQTFPQAPAPQARNRLRQLADQALAAEREPPLVGRLVECWVPPALTRSPARRRLTALIAVLAAVVVLVGGSILLLGGSPPPEKAPLLPAARDSPPTAAASPSKAAESSLVVSVVGKVRSPGLVTVPSGARVADALSAAGGALDGTDITALNLARKLTDGEQLYVGVAAPPPAAPQQADAPAAPGKLNLNTASAEQLDSLPGVGEVTAKRIIDWRTQHGSFSSIDQLQEVDGIGETKFSRLRDQVTV